MSDASNIFNLYMEAVEKEQPELTVDEHGTKSWWLHGKRHRKDAPAIEWVGGTKSWYLHDKQHREDGPAYEGISGYKEWWLHGKRYSTPEAWAQALLKQRNEPHDADAISEFLMPILGKYIA